MNKDVCEKHQWKAWMPNGIYHCARCGLFKLKFEGQHHDMAVPDPATPEPACTADAFQSEQS